MTGLLLGRARWLLPAAIFLVATLIALTGSWGVSLWTDEAITITAAERSLPELWALLQRIDAVHGLYYAFMHFWIQFFGASPFALRLPSALAIGATAVGVYVLGRRLATPRTALIAGLLAATLPRLMWAGIEARPFAFSALLAVWASYAFVVAAGNPRRWGWWAAYAGLAALGIIENIYLLLLVVAHGVTVIVRYRSVGRVWAGFLSAAALAGLLGLPVLLLARSQQGQLSSAGDRNPLSILRKVVVNQFFLGETPADGAAAPWFMRAWQVAAILAAVLGVAFMVLAIVRRARDGDGKAMILSLTLPWIAVPTAFVAGYAVLVAPLYQPRYFTFAAPAAALLLALGIRSLARRWYAIAAVALYVLTVSVVFVSQRIPFAKSGSDWAASSAIVAERSTPDDAVYFAPRDDTDELSQYTARRIATAYPEAFAGLEDVTILTTGAETGTFDGFSMKLADSDRLEGHDHLWMVYVASTAEAVLEADRAFLADEGFTGETVWSGPRSVVVEYTRE
ncbi:glycosyltransferase family 39 protein [Microbacterium sp.]|uniref:glycosyltransferase family 39 protein n=1 Tax=Microbacterium sp. TaxID=51671 RepID=UPI003F70C221